MLERWHGMGEHEIEAAIRVQFKRLAALPHMRPELSALFWVLANPAVTHSEVLAEATKAIDALLDVERFVTGQEKSVEATHLDPTLPPMTLPIRFLDDEESR
jgi:hypothetical protein